MKSKYCFTLAGMPFRAALRKIFGMRGKAYSIYRYLYDLIWPTYLRSSDCNYQTLHSYFPAGIISRLLPITVEIAGLTANYCNHRFDLLGSGWLQISHGMNCSGLENSRYNMGRPIVNDKTGKWLEGRISRANIADSAHVWNLLPQSYLPIDWHLDFKSGYRWSESTWHKFIGYGHKPGVDIKVPWELARMQHLPILAWAFMLAEDGREGFVSSTVYANEFRNQVLDFIAANPPRFGVNWRCTMDVGIRVANWLVAYDLFKIHGAKFDEGFEKIFIRSVYEHGLHIVNNLEWSPKLRANHYLSDIAGLIFVAAYLPASTEIDSWLAFAIHELIKEVGLQFYEDGSNFEGSTSYHRLSAELVIYATALVLRLPEQRFKTLSLKHPIKTDPKIETAPLILHPAPGTGRLTPFPLWYFERLEKMAEFVIYITKPNGRISQIGDNDSGRFFKLQPVYRRMAVPETRNCFENLKEYYGSTDNEVYWQEETLDHRHLVAAINGLFNREDFTAFTGLDQLETFLIKRLSGNLQVKSYLKPGQSIAAERSTLNDVENRFQFETDWENIPDDWQKVFAVAGGDLLCGLKTYAYPDFGLYIYRSQRLYLAIRCGSIGQNGNGGHSHNDQLAVELTIDGEDLTVDPGSYLYTPLPERRNLYRSIHSHFAPRSGEEEPAGMDGGLFILENAVDGECLWFGKSGFMGRHRDVEMLVQLFGDRIVLKAKSGRGKILWNGARPGFSDGYGWRRRL